MIDIPYKAINVLLEATEECNLRCKYCYHADDGYVKIRMEESIFVKVCELTFPYYEQIQFLWHGGEPLCVGIDFHKRILEIQKEYEKKYPKVKVINAIQTNGILIDKEVAEFFSNNDFTIGVSFDGIANEESRGKTKEVLRGIDLLRNAGVKNIGALTVISGVNVSHLDKDYEFMKELNLSTDYNSLVLTGGANHYQDVQLELNEYIENMIKFFDNWFYDTDCNIIINPFFSYVRDILFDTASICWRTSCLGRWINVKPDGCVYPCSREFPDDYSFGKIQEVESISDLYNSIGFEKLLLESIERREKCEKICRWYSYCQGGCSCTALTENGITNNGGFTCLSFKAIFAYCYNRLADLKKKDSTYIKNNINPTIVKMIIDTM